MNEAGNELNDMTHVELIAYRTSLYAQLKDFSLNAIKTEYILKLMKRINIRISKGTEL